MSAFNRLLNQIDSFIRKFYKNQIIKGLLLFVGVFLVSFLVVVILEYFGRFNSLMRAVLLFTFVGLNSYLFVKFLCIPFLKLKSFGESISRVQASEIIGSFFPNVSDRLLNTLQLNEKLDVNSADYELLNASIQQRSDSLSVVPFADAIDFRENKKFIKWVLSIFIVFGFIAFFQPDVLTKSTERVVKFSKDFPIEAPFSFNLNSELLPLEEGSDYLCKVQLLGSVIPEKVFIKTCDGVFRMKRNSKNEFVFKVEKLRDKFLFQFVSDYNGHDFQSKEFLLPIIGKSTLGRFEARCVFPKYLKREDELIYNFGDVSVPEGTTIVWNVLLKNTKAVNFKIGDVTKKYTSNSFKLNHTFKNTTSIDVVLQNAHISKHDSLTYRVDIVNDMYPTITVNEVKDSLLDGVRYFSGLVTDDHGLNGVRFHYEIKKKTGSITKKSIKVNGIGGNESRFDFAVDLRREEIQLEDRITYYFTVTDNDGVNGSKTSKSEVFIYELPTLQELAEERTEQHEQDKETLANLLKKAEQFQKDVAKTKKKLLNSTTSSWSKQETLKELRENQQSLENELKSLNEKINNEIDEKNQLSEVDEELLKQQEEISKLLEEVMDEELRDLLKKLEDLIKKGNKEDLNRELENLEMNSNDLKEQLDRSLEMLKKLQLDEKIDDVEKSLKELAKEQLELKEDISDKKIGKEDALKKQDEIDNKFQEVKEDLKKLDSLNKSLERPLDLKDPKEKTESVDENLKDAKENLSKSKESKAGENQESAADEMEEMADELDQQQNESNQSQQQEDIDMLRNILESLVSLSFDQEWNMKKLSVVHENDPAFKSYSRQQRRIIDDTKIVSDSLYALAKRQPKIASFVDKELNQINVNHNLILEDIDERRRRDLTVHQQFVMTSYNNLALLLNESLQQMQQQMKDSKPGSGSCNKPGGKGMPKPGDGMSQENMKDMLKKQLEEMQKGDSEGGNKPGKKPGEKPGGMGSGGMGNMQLSKMAAEQSMIRKRLEELRKELNKDGSGTGNSLNPLLEELKKQEEDIINKRLNSGSIKRQQEILTRLLESDKAIKERGLDDKRESTEGKNINNSNLIEFSEYNKEKLRQIELLRPVDPLYRQYYKVKAGQYFNREI